MSDDEKDPDPIDFEGQLKHYADVEPFVPFEIILTSGDQVLITDPWRTAFTTNSILWADPKKGFSFYRKNQIVGVQVHEPAH